jgi:hypothetical protein
MSWKSLVITGLLCVVASPVLAQGVPAITVVPTVGASTVSWAISVTPKVTGFVANSSVAAELDFDFTGTINSFTLNNAFWNVGGSNPGNNPFTGTNTETVIDNAPANDTIFIAAGSELFATATPQLLGTLVTQGTTGTLKLGGRTAAGHQTSRIAQGGTNYDGIIGQWSANPPVELRGDTNNDGIVNGFDIDPFVLVLTDLPAYQAAFPGVNGVARADINQDTIANGFDIDPFVVCVTNGGCAPGAGAAAASVGGSAVPEPTTALLCLCAASAVVCFRRSR